MSIVVLFLALGLACVAAQSRPKLSETFETRGIAQVRRNHTVHFGEGTLLESLFVLLAPILTKTRFSFTSQRGG